MVRRSSIWVTCGIWAERTWSPSTHTVATSDVEHSIEWQSCRIAVWQTHTSKDSSRNGTTLAKNNFTTQTHITTHILRISHTKNIVIALSRLVRKCLLEEVQQITRRLEVDSQQRRIATDMLILVVVGV